MDKVTLTPITDEDCHFIDGQLYLETLAALAFRDKKIDAYEYELHRDEHLRQIIERLNNKLAHSQKEVEAALEGERRAEMERLALLLCSYGLCPPITCKHTDSFSCKDCWIAVLEQGKRPGGEQDG